MPFCFPLPRWPCRAVRCNRCKECATPREQTSPLNRPSPLSNSLRSKRPSLNCHKSIGSVWSQKPLDRLLCRIQWAKIPKPRKDSVRKRAANDRDESPANIALHLWGTACLDWREIPSRHPNRWLHFLWPEAGARIAVRRSSNAFLQSCPVPRPDPDASR